MLLHRVAIINRPHTTHTSGVANSTTFKTSVTFVAQPVLAGTPEVKQLIKLYVDHVRPYAALEGEDEATARLIIRHDGLPDEFIERYVSSFFLTELNCKITITTIRHIVDTTARDLRLRGGMNDAQFGGILFVNGHSDATSKNYYTQ